MGGPTPEGRFDGEDNNWGLVSESDTPYQALTERAALVHADLDAILEVDPGD